MHKSSGILVTARMLGQAVTIRVVVDVAGFRRRLAIARPFLELGARILGATLIVEGERNG